ncbi:amidohydrolase [Agromyces aurantiacus]|uniref:Amidohydrolase n=1 Tax=Agromyces aurantiacus TaxID=165814 RepID=A0ABV9R404_9MICO|nr:amidohydrolase [Agromyces aurantiacus]MBM7503043.1 hippurate hydrolase [Agromyces aurantiacus]
MGIDLAELYRDLHANPELSYQEHRTAGIAADHLRGLGYEVTTGLGGTGVLGVLRNGDGPTVLLRADMDALPVEEATGLEYASTRRGIDPAGADVPVMHACGHDVHVTCLVGSAERLAAERERWRGTLAVVFQPAEELGSGAHALARDGLFERIPRPDVVLGQHVAPFPAGYAAIHPGVAFAGDDSLTIVLHGAGGHGSRPETTVDPVVLAASVITRLQAVVSREIAATESAVVSVGQVHAGKKNNIIPSEARLGLSVRTFDAHVRERVLAAIERIVHAEAAASVAPTPPEIITDGEFPPTVNDAAATERTAAALRRALGDERVIDPGVVSGSEDVGVLADAGGAPLAYWVLGGADPALFEDFLRTGRLPDVPSNHSPHYAPVIEPTLATGVDALVAAAREWLAEPEAAPAP